MTEKTLEQLAQEFQKHVDTVKEIAEEFKGKQAKSEEISQSAKDKADEALTTLNEVKNKLTELEQKAARRGNGDVETKSKPWVVSLLKLQNTKMLQKVSIVEFSVLS